MQKYIKKYKIHSFECDSKLRLRIRSLFNIFQDLADDHANLMGLGYHYCQSRQIGWVGAAYHVQINRLPKWEEDLTFATWPSQATPVAGIRDFTVSDGAGNPLILASSMWVVLDLNKMRAVPVARCMPAYEVLPEQALIPDFSKQPPLERIDKITTFSVRVDEIDLYNHVNNAVYPCWIFEAFDDTFLQTHDVAELKITFKHSALRGDEIVMHTQIDGLTSRHVIQSATGQVFADITARWRSV